MWMVHVSKKKGPLMRKGVSQGECSERWGDPGDVPTVNKTEILGEVSVSYRVSYHFELESPVS